MTSRNLSNKYCFLYNCTVASLHCCVGFRILNILFTIFFYIHRDAQTINTNFVIRNVAYVCRHVLSQSLRTKMSHTVLYCLSYSIQRPFTLPWKRFRSKRETEEKKKEKLRNRGSFVSRIAGR